MKDMVQHWANLPAGEGRTDWMLNVVKYITDNNLHKKQSSFLVACPPEGILSVRYKPKENHYLETDDNQFVVTRQGIITNELVMTSKECWLCEWHDCMYVLYKSGDKDGKFSYS